MAINKKIIHFKNKEDFDLEVADGNILDNSIVFIQDSKEISTHGTVYKSVNWSVLGVSLITFTFEGIEYLAEEGMSFILWCDSDYNTTKNTSAILMYDDSLNLFWEQILPDETLYIGTIVDKNTIIVNNGIYG